MKPGVIDKKLVAAVNDLRDLRNAVAHGAYNPTPGEALSFEETARRLGETFKMIATLDHSA
jgi:hypothetical protein